MLAGHAVFFDFNCDALAIRETERAEILAEIKVNAPPDPDLPPADAGRGIARVAATVEVFDNTGIDAGKSRMGWTNHNETLVSDTRITKRPKLTRSMDK